jgi:hypothetical protein
MRRTVPWFAKNLASLACRFLCRRFLLLSGWSSLKWGTVPETAEVTQVLQAIIPGSSAEQLSHLCPMKLRGIQRQNDCTITSALLGKFRDDYQTLWNC